MTDCFLIRCQTIPDSTCIVWSKGTEPFVHIFVGRSGLTRRGDGFTDCVSHIPYPAADPS